jgi:hypothetical protein
LQLHIRRGRVVEARPRFLPSTGIDDFDLTSRPPVERHDARQGFPVIVSGNSNRFKNGGAHTCVEEAFRLLTIGGDALDAVIAGVNIVERDPEDASVGYGGLPNADTRQGCGLRGVLGERRREEEHDERRGCGNGRSSRRFDGCKTVVHGTRPFVARSW